MAWANFCNPRWHQVKVKLECSGYRRKNKCNNSKYVLTKRLQMRLCNDLWTRISLWTLTDSSFNPTMIQAFCIHLSTRSGSIKCLRDGLRKKASKFSPKDSCPLTSKNLQTAQVTASQQSALGMSGSWISTSLGRKLVVLELHLFLEIIWLQNFSQYLGLDASEQ